jgi:3-phenylpropionate/trans-cinnamate dioxygenase ferredoxin reductase subunit
VTLKQRIAEAHHGVVVIGGGFIGLEVAAAARMAGKPVTVIEAAPRLMARAVSPVLSSFFLDLHRAQGTEVLLNTVAIEVRPDAVTLENGRRIAADLVVAGIGVIPNVELARDAGLEVNNGIMVDEFMRTTDPAIFAIGDCAEHPNVFAGGRARLESVQNAVDQARCVARVIMGQPEPYRDVPWFWTDQFAMRFQMAGLSGGHDQSALRGSIEARKFSVFYFQRGRLLAVDSVNRPGDHITARKMLAAGTPLTPEQAADEMVDLKQLTAAQRAG